MEAELEIKAVLLSAPRKSQILPYRATRNGKSIPHQVLTMLPRTQHVSGTHYYPSYSWELSHPPSPHLPVPQPLCSQDPCPSFSRVIVNKWSLHSRLLTSAFGLPGRDDSVTTAAIRMARKSFSFFSQACNSVTKADEISALDTLFRDIHCSAINLLVLRKLLEEMVKGNCLLSIPELKQGALLFKKKKKIKKCFSLRDVMTGFTGAKC